MACAGYGKNGRLWSNSGVIRWGPRPLRPEFFGPHSRKGITMSELRDRMIRDMQLAGLVEGTRTEYLRAVRQLAAYYMLSPDRLSERKVEDYLLYVRDELGVAKGTFAPIFFGLKFFYVQSLGYNWPLFTKKKVRKPRRQRLPDVRSDEDCRRLIATLQQPVYRGCFALIYAYGLRIHESVTVPVRLGPAALSHSRCCSPPPQRFRPD